MTAAPPSVPTSLVQQFVAATGRGPTIVAFAPGRINLLGEHTDYNDGFVLPAAIDRGVWVAADPRSDQRVQLWAVDLDAEDRFPLNEIEPLPRSHWANYPRGMTALLRRRGWRLPGANFLFTSTLPMGAGLSSSAALTTAVGIAWRALSQQPLATLQLAELAQRVEHEFAGVACGIMDQLACGMGRTNAAIRIDCRTREVLPVPLPPSLCLVAMDTTIRRGLADSAYNERRRQCEVGTDFFRRARAEVRALRDVTPRELAKSRHALPDPIWRRCRHVITENQRVEDGATALERGAVSAFGQLMNESHQSLRDDFEVSCPELDAIVAAAQSAPGVIGARMTGAGFGGCAVALVETSRVAAFCDHVGAAYANQTKRAANLIVCAPTKGARVVAETMSSRAGPT